MFGRNPRPTPPSQPPPQQPSVSYNRIPQASSDRYGDPQGRPLGGSQRPYYDGAPPEKHEYSRGQSRQGPGGQTWQLQPAKLRNERFTFGNIVAVSPFDFPPSQGSPNFYVILNNLYVCTARTEDSFAQGQIGLSEPQRSWTQISLQDIVHLKRYDPFQEGGPRYLGSLDVEIGFATSRETEDPFDQDELQQYFSKVYQLARMIPRSS